MKHLGVQTSLSTAYHPQTDGTTERFNQEIEAYLSIYCTSHPEDWVDALPVLEFTHNNRRHSDRKNTPFELMMGMSPLATPLVHEYTKYPSIEERVRSLINIREEARMNLHEIACSNELRRTSNRSLLDKKYGLKPEISKQFTTRKSHQNVKDRLPLPTSYHHSCIPSIYHRRGASIMHSTHFYSLRTSKMMFMVQIIRDHQRT
jgi:hypothetical protein